MSAETDLHLTPIVVQLTAHDVISNSPNIRIQRKAYAKSNACEAINQMSACVMPPNIFGDPLHQELCFNHVLQTACFHRRCKQNALIEQICPTDRLARRQNMIGRQQD